MSAIYLIKCQRNTLPTTFRAAAGSRKSTISSSSFNQAFDLFSSRAARLVFLDTGSSTKSSVSESDDWINSSTLTTDRKHASQCNNKNKLPR